jgi:hypothetical protein
MGTPDLLFHIAELLSLRLSTVIIKSKLLLQVKVGG